jgi:hypothetical protein
MGYKPVIAAIISLVVIVGWWAWSASGGKTRAAGTVGGSPTVGTKASGRMDGGGPSSISRQRDFRAELDGRRIVSDLRGRELAADSHAKEIVTEWVSVDPDAALGWATAGEHPLLQDLIIEVVVERDLNKEKELEAISKVSCTGMVARA